MLSGRVLIVKVFLLQNINCVGGWLPEKDDFIFMKTRNLKTISLIISNTVVEMLGFFVV